MRSLYRRAVAYLVFITALILLYAVAYHYGMRTFEGESYSFLHSVQVVVETFTATGFGSDSPWSSREMNLLVIVMDLTGVALFFMALPVLLFPLFEDLFSPTVRSELPEDVADHVVVCSYTSRADTLVAELDSRGIDYVLVESDRDTAMDLDETGYEVVHADPESVDGLERANAAVARAVVADVSDRVDASIVLAARELAEDVRVVSVVESPEAAPYHRLAGADAVLTPRQILGEGLGNKVATVVSTDLGDAVEIGEDFDLAELPIHRGSELAGTTLAESGIRERFGVNVIGAWNRGEFQSPPSPDATLDSGSVLLVTGREDQLERLRELTVSDLRQFRAGETVVLGYGDVGQVVVELLEAVDIPYTVVDRRDRPGVDVVGDASDPDVQQEAGVEGARSVVLALPDDTATEYATLVARDRNESAEIVARAEHSGAIAKTYRAGADYVLSLDTVSGRMLASEVLEDEEVLSLDTSVEVVRTTAPGLAGETLAGADVRARTGCTVIAVERDGEVITDLDSDFRVEAGDELVVAGHDEGVNEFVRLLG